MKTLLAPLVRRHEALANVAATRSFQFGRRGDTRVPKTKIVNETEVLRWMAEGRTYAWMVREYERKYKIQTTPAMWGNFRRSRGLDRRQARSVELIPWQVMREHQWSNDLAMLRFEARLREGRELKSYQLGRLESWKARLNGAGDVVHYDPATPRGFLWVKPRAGVDMDLIRVPERVTSRRAVD